MSTTEIYNYIQVNENLITGGQPTEDQLRSAAAEGFTTVINLATLEPGRSLEDEAGLVRSLGMAYYPIPVEWGRPKASDFTAFVGVMDQLLAREMPGKITPKPEKVLLHCAANFRATAFYSLYAQKRLGWSDAQAEAFRAQIWHDSQYPVWEQFIAQIKAE
jgi:protein tyrosine phosphatase (PTP) superfamily phosphohydrolase (DUF442 family)